MLEYLSRSLPAKIPSKPPKHPRWGPPPMSGEYWVNQILSVRWRGVGRISETILGGWFIASGSTPKGSWRLDMWVSDVLFRNVHVFNCLIFIEVTISLLVGLYARISPHNHVWKLPYGCHSFLNKTTLSIFGKFRLIISWSSKNLVPCPRQP